LSIGTESADWICQTLTGALRRLDSK
jgi:hypothetical protein